MKNRFEESWEKLIFIGSVVGLIFLIAISLFRYYYLIPRQENTSENFKKTQQIIHENRELKAEIHSLKKKIDED